MSWVCMGSEGDACEDVVEGDHDGREVDDQVAAEDGGVELGVGHSFEVGDVAARLVAASVKTSSRPRLWRRATMASFHSSRSKGRGGGLRSAECGRAGHGTGTRG